MKKLSSIRNAAVTCVLLFLNVVPASLASGQTKANSQNQIPDLQQLLSQLKNDQRQTRANAVINLLHYQDRYKEFVKPLARQLVERDEIIYDSAKRVFRQLGVKAVQALEPDFATKNLDDFRQVCSAINAVGDPCLEYKEELLNVLRNSDDPFRRTSVTFALTGFSKGCPEAIEPVLRDLRHEDMNVTLFAMRLIIKTGPKAWQAVPDLVRQLDEGVISQRSYANWALAAIGPREDFDIVAATEKQLNKFYAIERERALISAGILGEAAGRLVPKIREMMLQDGSNMEASAAIALWQITGQADESVQRLIQISSEMPEYEVTGLQKIGEMGSAAVQATDTLTERLQSSDHSILVAALEALGKIGPACNTDSKASKAVQKVHDQSTSPLIKLVAAATLKAINGP